MSSKFSGPRKVTIDTTSVPRTTTIEAANLRYYYLCPCGRWWGRNKSFKCECGELPPSRRIVDGKIVPRNPTRYQLWLYGLGVRTR